MDKDGERMKIVIDIPNELYKGIEERDGSLETEYVCDELMKAVDNGTPLPDNATNGDVIKALFPKSNMAYRLWTDNTYFCETDWWNAPYKAGDTEESDAEFMCRVMSKTINKSTDDRNFIGRC